MEEVISYTNEMADTIVEGPINLTQLAYMLAGALDDEYFIYDSEPYINVNGDTTDIVECSDNLDSTTQMDLSSVIGRMILHHLKVVAPKE